jgi:hypothetical protein
MWKSIRLRRREKVCGADLAIVLLVLPLREKVMPLCEKVNNRPRRKEEEVRGYFVFVLLAILPRVRED